MLKQIVISLTVIALIRGSAALAGEPASPSAVDEARMLVGTWNCQTTQAGGLIQAEEDRIEQIGTGPWLHGTSRAADGSAGSPFYDFYVGYDGAHWVYIQIYPSAKFYFVGVSDGSALASSAWQIVYPVHQGGYDFKLSSGAFAIRYPDLTQSCQREAAPRPPLSPALESTLTCSTTYLGHETSTTVREQLTISQPQRGVPWWQGVAKNEATGEIVYAYNLFDLPSQRMSVLVNPSTNAYAIAVGSPSKDLNYSVWMVVYPRVQSGFSFKGVTYRADRDNDTVPSALTVIFKDGYQQCRE